MSINGTSGFWMLEFYNEFGATRGDISIKELINNCLVTISLLKAIEFNQPLSQDELIRKTKHLVKIYYLTGNSKDKSIDFSDFATTSLQEIINVEYSLNNQNINAMELLEFYEDVLSVNSNVPFMDLAKNYNQTDNYFKVVYANSSDIDGLKQGVKAIIKAYYLKEKIENIKTEFTTFMETTIQDIIRIQSMFEDYIPDNQKARH